LSKALKKISALNGLGKKGGIMPFVYVVMVEGRTKEQKAKLARRFTDDMVEILEVGEESVHIAFQELPRENFTWRGLLLTEKPK